MRFLVLGTAALIALAGPIHADAPAALAARESTLTRAAQGAAATVDSFHAALRRGDTAAAAGLLTEDALIFEGGAAERSKAEYAGHHLPADAAFSQAVASVVTRRTGNAAGMLAWIASEGRTTGTYQGKPIDLVTTETMLLRRVGRTWRITHIHWSSRKRK
jgi:ketosteroid isomerase-like protein